MEKEKQMTTEVRTIENAEEKRRICRAILEALPEWFGIPEAREEYVSESADKLFFAAMDGENPVGFLCLKETGRDTVELYVMGVLKARHRTGAGRALVEAAKRAAREAGMPVIGSCHDFEKTPDAEEMAARLCRMAALGADVCKIAVMPRRRRDVVALTAACAQADDALTQPIIAISMGEMGMPTRICAEAMGSCLSFGTAGAASAPGQMEAGALREALALVHRALAREAQEF